MSWVVRGFGPVAASIRDEAEPVIPGLPPLVKYSRHPFAAEAADREQQPHMFGAEEGCTKCRALIGCASSLPGFHGFRLEHVFDYSVLPGRHRSRFVRRVARDVRLGLEHWVSVAEGVGGSQTL